MDEFQRWIIEQLNIRGWSRSDFAQRLHVSQPIVSKWLSRHPLGQGRHIPADARLQRMAEVFEVPVEEVRWRAAHRDQSFNGAQPAASAPVGPHPLIRAICLAAAAYSVRDQAIVLQVADRYLEWVIGS